MAAAVIYYTASDPEKRGQKYRVLTEFSSFFKIFKIFRHRKTVVSDIFVSLFCVFEREPLSIRKVDTKTYRKFWTFFCGRRYFFAKIYQSSKLLPQCTAFVQSLSTLWKKGFKTLVLTSKLKK